MLKISVASERAKPRFYRTPVFVLGVICALATTATLADTVSGHLKYRAQAAHYPDDSLFRQLGEAQAYDHSADLRLQWSAQQGQWSVQVDYQLLGIAGDGVDLAKQLAVTGGAASTLTVAGSSGFPDDDRRLFDLTHRFSDQDRHILLHRLDRAHITYTGQQSVWRLGRQVLSWGNGLIYNPVDFFNPFDPAAVDTEYKTGDDMLYGQYLFNNGDDLQGVYVARRDDEHDVTRDVASTALKYHAWWGEQEWDLLMAEHYDESIVAMGVARDIGGAVWRSDVMAVDASDHWTWSLVTNLSYSWRWWDKNISGVAEYYYNGFGETGDQLSTTDLLENPALRERLTRGELYTTGRQYIAGSLTIEMTPLLNFRPGVFVNLSDQSSLWQWVVQYDPSQNIQVLGSLNIPIGPSGTEFGGVDLEPGNLQLSRGLSASIQLGWYF
ncbi:hypothetical protein [Maricurvus nonylphenolicus]|uniref:hypothetical protein n=1 Tax=Maricurvus nonylphenolicus TaxID=1008307 RepID=UPI0036F3C9A3